MKRILSIAVILLLTVFCLCGCEEEGYPKPTEQFFVNDFAEVMDNADESEILAKAVALHGKTTAQVVTVTVEDLNGEEPSQYALELGREWGIGTEEADNGIVILLSENDREIYIAVGYGLEGALPDSKTGRIIDVYGLEYLQQDNFSKGLLLIADAIINEVYIEYGLEPEAGYTSIDSIYLEQGLESDAIEVAMSWVILIVVVILYFLLFNRRGRGIFMFGVPHVGGFRGGRGGRGGFGGSSFGGFRGGGGSFGGGGAGRGF